MHKPVLFKGKSFQLTDHRRGDDYKDPQFFELLRLIKDRAVDWEELFSFVLNEFNTPKHIQTIDIRLMGQRSSFLGKANRSNGYIKLTTWGEYHNESPVEVLIHELGHITTPIEYKNGRRVIHGRRFKETTYRIAQYAYAVGLIREDQVSYSIGNATKENMSEAAQMAKKTQKTFRVGDIVLWTHTGHKHGGRYTGRIKRVNRKTYSIEELTKNGVDSGFRGLWKMGRGTTKLSLVE